VAVATAAVILLVVPAARAGAHLTAARQKTEAKDWRSFGPSIARYEAAHVAYRLDGTAMEELTDELRERVASVEQVDRALRYVDAVRARDPHNPGTDQREAIFRFRRFQLVPVLDDLNAAIDDMHAAVAQYPTHPDRRILLGSMLEQKGTMLSSADDLSKAAAEYQLALELDEKRYLVSAPNQLPAERRAELTARIERINKDPRLKRFGATAQQGVDVP
jgi:tetratricopeptide (TPR) repeat protein